MTVRAVFKRCCCQIPPHYPIVGIRNLSAESCMVSKMRALLQRCVLRHGLVLMLDADTLSLFRQHSMFESDQVEKRLNPRHLSRFLIDV